MTLLGREVLRFVLEAILWLGLEAVIAAAIVVTTAPLVNGALRKRVVWAVAGAMVGAALAIRFGLPLAWAPGIGTRPLPVAWSAAGAIIAGVALWSLALRTEDRQPEG